MKLTRRSFIQAGAGLALSASAPSFALPNTGRKPYSGFSLAPQDKALVFIMLDGGNDSFNMLVPLNGKANEQYRRSRSNLALSPSDLLPLDSEPDSEGRRFGVHPSMPEVQGLFKRRKLSFVSNIGPMISPLNKRDFQENRVPLPVGLLSHSDQFKHWQTSRPGERINRGWFGSFADVLQPGKAVDQIAMNISLSGSNIMQNGVDSTHYTITRDGSVGLVVNEEKNDLNAVILKSFEGLLNEAYADDPLKQSYLAITREAQAQHEVFKRAIAPAKLRTHFSEHELSQQLKMVARSIASAKRLRHRQQTFFIRYIGWDHHDELINNHARMLRVVSTALGEFQSALEELGVSERVITFTGSDFGRTLTSNGNGTDHGWGGNTLVMGDAIQGGQIFGDYPALTLGRHNPLDAGDGVIIPTTATDELYAELAQWFGVGQDDLPGLFPNLSHFPRAAKGRPLGIVKL